MGLFDSLFGSDTVETTSETDSKVRFPVQFRDLATAVGQMGSELAGRDPNHLVAGFSPDQLAAFQALRDMATTDPTGYFDIINQLQQEGLSAGDNAALTSGLSSLTNLVQTSQNDPTVAASIDKLMADPSARDVNAESYRPGVATDTVSASPYSTAAIEDTMSPYRDQVIGKFNENFNAQADRTRAASARERAGRRAFGSRSDLAETEEDKNLTDSYSTALTNLLESGFTNAQGQFNTNTGVSVDTQKANQAARLQAGLAGQQNALTAEQGNQGRDIDLAKLGQSGAQAAGALALDRSKLGADVSSSLTAAGIDQSKLGLAGAQAAGDAASQERATAIGNAGLVSSVGDAYAQKQQQVLDAPWTQLDRAAGVLAGVPTTASSTTTGTAPSGNPSPISQLAGAGLAAYGIYQGSADGGVVGGLDADFLSPRGLKRVMADGGKVGRSPDLADMDPAILEDMLARPNLPPEKRRRVIAALKAAGRADGGQVGVKATEPDIGESDPRFATSLTDDTWYARDLGFDINDPEFYDGDLAADIGANPFYAPETVLGDYRYGQQMPAWGAMPMLPENDMTWQLMEGESDGKARSMRGVSEAMSRKLTGNPYYGASIDDLAKALENPNLPEKLRQAALDIVQMYVHLDEFADGGAINVNPFLGRSRDDLINLLYSGTLSPEERAQVRAAINDTAAVSGAAYDMPIDEQTGVTAAALDQGRLASGLAENAEWATEPENAEFFRDQSVVAGSDARQLGTDAAAGTMLTPTFASPLDNPAMVGGPMDKPRAPLPLVPTSAVPMTGTVPLTGRYEAVRGGQGEPRSIETPRRLATGLSLIDGASTAPSAAAAVISGAGAPYVAPDRIAASGPGWYDANVVAPAVTGGLDFSQPGSMIQGVQQIIAGPTPTGTLPPSSGRGTPVPGLPGSSSPLESSPGAPPFAPPIPMRPPERGEAASPSTPLDDRDWVSRVMDNPFFQLGIAMMGSTRQGLLPAFADAAAQVAGQRAAADEAEYKRSLAERGIAVDEGGLALRQAQFAAALAEAGRAGGGGGGRRGGGGGGSGGGGSGGSTAGGSPPTQVKQIEYLTASFIASGDDPATAEAKAIAMVYNEDLPGAADTTPDYLIDEGTALEMAIDADPDWDLLTADERVRRLDAYRRGQNPTAGGFGGIGGLDFYGGTAAPPPGFTLNP